MHQVRRATPEEAVGLLRGRAAETATDGNPNALRVALAGLAT